MYREILALTEEDGDAAAQIPEVDIAVLADLAQQIESLKAQLEDRSTQYMRIAADFENYRKRTPKEKEEIELQVKTKHNYGIATSS